MGRSEWGQALVQLERAAAAMPDRAEPHRLRGDVLFRLQRDEPAIEAWSRARTLDPLLAHDASLAFDLAIAATRLGRLDVARSEYQRVVDATGPGHRLRSLSLGNAAELAMAEGPDRLDEAIDLYRESLADRPGNLLALWGVALALDRAGRTEESAAQLDRLRRGDPALAALADDDVFFVPPEEIHAYRALGFSAFGNVSGAVDAWQAFLGGGGGEGPWAEHARERLAAAQQRLAREPRRAPAARTP
jgi:tetratricopeptide (TPR) repeat protein